MNVIEMFYMYFKKKCVNFVSLDVVFQCSKNAIPTLLKSFELIKKYFFFQIYFCDRKQQLRIFHVQITT